MYALNEAGNPVKVDRLRIAHGKGFGRLMRTGTSFSYTFNNDTFKKKNKNNDNRNNDNNNPPESGAQNDRDRQDRMDDHNGMNMNPDGYVKWSVPWSLTLNYSVNYGYGAFNKEKLEYDGRITQNLSFSGNIQPTPNWNFSFSASYNFDTHKLAYMNCNISRDMHCFQMRASFVPVGPYKSYNFHISVKSSRSNGIDWY